jgi:hypothetical protein
MSSSSEALGSSRFTQSVSQREYASLRVCACVCVCACVRACVCACVWCVWRACVCGTCVANVVRGRRRRTRARSRAGDSPSSKRAHKWRAAHSRVRA